jgi:hypothetical protein
VIVKNNINLKIERLDNIMKMPSIRIAGGAVLGLIVVGVIPACS